MHIRTQVFFLILCSCVHVRKNMGWRKKSKKMVGSGPTQKKNPTPYTPLALSGRTQNIFWGTFGSPSPPSFWAPVVVSGKAWHVFPVIASLKNMGGGSRFETPSVRKSYIEKNFFFAYTGRVQLIGGSSVDTLRSSSLELIQYMQNQILY